MNSLSGRQMSIVVLCKGCLSYDRRCNTIVDNAELFLQILYPNNVIYKKWEEMDLLLCWECEATLKSIRTFQNKIQQAQGFLQQITEQQFQIEHKCLSSLTIEKRPEYNLIINNNNEITIKTNKTVPNIPIVDLSRTKSVDLQINRKSDSIEIKTKNNKLLNTKKKTNNNIFEENLKLSIPCKEETLNINDLNEQLLQISSTDNFVFNPDDIEVKKESDNFYLSDINDQCSDYGLEEIKQEKNNVKKRKRKSQVKYPRVSKRKEIDFNNIDQYFTKINISKEEYMVHLKNQVDKLFLKTKYRCNICVLVFRNRKSLILHEEMHETSKGDFVCDICTLRFQTQEDMSSHHSTHLSVDRCNICHYICRYESVKLRHMKSAHGLTGYYQCQCSLLYGNRNELRSHLEDMHRRYLCNDCGKRNNSKKALLKHIYSQHVSKPCHLCPKKYKDQYKLQKHLVEVHDLEKSYRSKEDMYCVECDKQYPTRMKYKKHLQHSPRHKPTLKKSIPCPVCGKIFSRTNYMNNHFKLYHGEARYRCEPCNKTYCNNFGLKCHIKRVHEKVPLLRNKVCETCGQSFTTNRILIHHIRTHTGERPHACDYCPARFAQKYARDVHVKNIHLKHISNFVP